MRVDASCRAPPSPQGPSISHVQLQRRVVRFEDATLTGATECCFDEATGVFISYTGKALYFYPAATALTSSAGREPLCAPAPISYQNSRGGCLLSAKLSPCFTMVALHFAKEPKKIFIVNLRTKFEFEVLPSQPKAPFSPLSSSSSSLLSFAYFSPTSAAAAPQRAVPAAPEAWSSAPFHLRRDVKQKRPPRQLQHDEGGTPRKPLILGFFWLEEIDEAEDGCFFVVSTASIELFTFLPPPLQGAKSLRVLKTVPIRWYSYEPRLRLLLLSSSPAHSAVTGLRKEQFGSDPPPLSVMAFQVQKKSKGGLLKLPRFDLPSDDPCASEGKDVPLQVHTPVLLPLELYGVPFCAHLHVQKRELVLYQLGRELVTRRFSILLGMNLLKNRLKVAAVDNLLLIFFAETKLTLLYDIRVSESSPIAAPLPIFAPSVAGPLSQAPMMGAPWRLFGRGLLLAPDCDTIDEEREREGELPDAVGEAHRRDITRIGEQVNTRVSTTSSVWTIGLNLEGIVASSTDRVANVQFLLHRCNGRQTLITTLHAAVKEGGLSMAKAFAALHEPFLDSQERIIESRRRTASVRWKASSAEKDDRHTEKSFSAVNCEEVMVLPYDKSFPEDLRFEDSPILDQRLRSITAVPEDAEELIDGTTNYNAEGDILFLPLDALENVFQPLARGCTVPLISIGNAMLEYARAAEAATVTVPTAFYDFAFDMFVESADWGMLQNLLQCLAIPPSPYIASKLNAVRTKFRAAPILLQDVLGRVEGLEQQLIRSLLNNNEKGREIDQRELFASARNDEEKFAVYRYLRLHQQMIDPSVERHLFGKNESSHEKQMAEEKAIPFAEVDIEGASDVTDLQRPSSLEEHPISGSLLSPSCLRATTSANEGQPELPQIEDMEMNGEGEGFSRVKALKEALEGCHDSA